MGKDHGGARKGAGRKRKDEELKELALYDATIDDDKWMALIRSVYDKAIKGDTAAAKLLFERRFGKVVEIDGDVVGGLIVNVTVDDK